MKANPWQWSLPIDPLLDRLIALSLEEDLGSGGDVTTRALIAPSVLGRATLVAKAPIVVSGIGAFGRIFATVDPRIAVVAKIQDGQRVPAGTVVAQLSGSLASLLVGERTALNFIQRTSGIATVTAAAVAKLAKPPAHPTKILDTRKTAPGMRGLSKAAVRDGGGSNHRVGLFDGILIKDNHLAALGGNLEVALARAKRNRPRLTKVEIEVTNLSQLDRAIAAGAESVLLDNMDDAILAKALSRCRGAGVESEVSGGVTLDRIPLLQKLGADGISLGALTHSAPAVDFSLEFASRRARS